MNNLSFWDKILINKTRQNRSLHGYSFVPYEQVKHIIFVLDFDKDFDNEHIKKAVDRLKRDGKDVYLVFLTKKKNNQSANQVITYKQILGIIKIDSSQSTEFLNKEYDLAIGYDTERNLILEYFLASLNARQIALPYFSDDTLADILIKTKTDSIENFVNQVINFLTTIKTQ